VAFLSLYLLEKLFGAGAGTRGVRHVGEKRWRKKGNTPPNFAKLLL
jgi:hypothetical protein